MWSAVEASPTGALGEEGGQKVQAGLPHTLSDAKPRCRVYAVILEPRFVISRCWSTKAHRAIGSPALPRVGNSQG